MFLSKIGRTCLYNFTRRTVILAILLSYPTFSISVWADKKSKALSTGLERDKRSCIQAVDGYAYLSEEMTIAESRKAAFLNAKRQAVEMAKTYVSSQTKVVNLETEYDVIWMESEGRNKGSVFYFSLPIIKE